MNAALLTSNSDEWMTPLDFFAPLDAELGGFAVDAACTPQNGLAPVRLTAAMHERGSLGLPWHRYSRGDAIWCNPPYSVVDRFVAKAICEARQGSPVVMLVPARTDTQWWLTAIEAAVEVRLVVGRVRFEQTRGKRGQPAPFPSALLFFRHSPNPGGPRHRYVRADNPTISARIP